MGRIKNIISSKLSGNVGAMNFRRRSGETVVAERVYTNKSKGAGATEAQRIHRSRLANIVNFYRVIQRIQQKAWENKDPRQSNFNVFSSINLASSPIFLTKEEARLHAAVIAAYVVSRGNLAPVAYTYNGNAFETDVNVGDFALLDATVAAISTAIVNNNSGWALGDKLSVAILTQSMRSVAGQNIPAVDVKYFELTLDATDSTLLADLDNYTALGVAISNSKLIFSNGASGGFAVHSREGVSFLQTSEQMVVVNPADVTIMNRYSGDAQKQKAMDSYGYKPDVLLTPFSEVETVIIEPAFVSSVTLAGQPLSDGGTYNQGGQLIVMGDGLSRQNIQVMNGSEVYTPQSESSQQQTFYISYPGNYRIIINGNVAYTFTGTMPIPADVTLISVGSVSSTTIPLVRDCRRGASVAVVVEGNDLGTLSCTGGRLSAEGGDSSRRTASFIGSSESSDTGYTISVGTTVVAQGSLTS